MATDKRAQKKQSVKPTERSKALAVPSRDNKIKNVLEMIASGQSVKQSCAVYGIPMTTFLENVDGDKYARARDSQADVHFHELADLAEDVKRGMIEPQAARVAADIIKWRVARMKPKAYGDRAALEVSGNDGGPLVVNVVRFGDER